MRLSKAMQSAFSSQFKSLAIAYFNSTWHTRLIRQSRSHNAVDKAKQWSAGAQQSDHSLEQSSGDPVEPM